MFRTTVRILELSHRFRSCTRPFRLRPCSGGSQSRLQVGRSVRSRHVFGHLAVFSLNFQCSLYRSLSSHNQGPAEMVGSGGDGDKASPRPLLPSEVRALCAWRGRECLHFFIRILLALIYIRLWRLGLQQTATPIVRIDMRRLPSWAGPV